MQWPRVTVLVLLAGGCATTDAVPGPTHGVPGPTHAVSGSTHGSGPTHVVSGTAETVTFSCGTPPYPQPARAVRIYLAGTRGDPMPGRPYEVATVSAERRFTARLPAGHYCLSAGGAAPICDAELVVPAAPGSVVVSHTIPNQARCDYDAPRPTIQLPSP